MTWCDDQRLRCPEYCDKLARIEPVPVMLAASKFRHDEIAEFVMTNFFFTYCATNQADWRGCTGLPTARLHI